ncbi:MAG: cyclic nucleotide-binding domain-containing protein [Chloroflexi bacterium]|nr:cyclic nucleotide-binding domain-containing protein [Chloroflexota bacterium]
MTAKQVLKGCVLFFGLSDSELEKVASLAVEKQYEAGTTIFTAGDSAEALFVLQEGRVAIQMTLPETGDLASRRITVDVVTKNEILGWSAILEPYKYTFTAVCIQQTVALLISGNKLRSLLRDNHKIGYEVMEGLAKVIAAGLNDTRQVLIAERLLPAKLT